MRILKVELSILAVILLLTCPIRATADDLPRELERALASLAAEDQDSRVTGLREVASLREDVAKRLVAQIEAGLKNPDRRYVGPLHCAVSAAGRWRVTEAVPMLIEHIDFTLDPRSFPIGIGQQLITYYPIALALSRIQGADVSTRVLELLATPGNEDKLRAATWVLSESLGRDLAKLTVDGMIERAAEGAAKEQLTSARALLDQRGILLPPKRPPPGPVQQPPMTE